MTHSRRKSCDRRRARACARRCASLIVWLWQSQLEVCGDSGGSKMWLPTRTHVPGWSFRNTRGWKSDCVPLSNAATQETAHFQTLNTKWKIQRLRCQWSCSIDPVCLSKTKQAKQGHQIFRSMPKSCRLQAACNDRLVPWFMRQQTFLGFRTTQVMKAQRNQGWLLCWAPSGWWNLDFFWSAMAWKFTASIDWSCFNRLETPSLCISPFPSLVNCDELCPLHLVVSLLRDAISVTPIVGGLLVLWSVEDILYWEPEKCSSRPICYSEMQG